MSADPHLDHNDEERIIVLIGEYRRLKCESYILPHQLEMINDGMMRAAVIDPLRQIPRVLEDAREMITPLRW